MGDIELLENKTIVLGVTGSVAAYKAVDIASKLTQQKARVEVIMTSAATRFVSPLAFRSVTGRPVAVDMFSEISEYHVEHVALAEAADVVVIAPASGNTIAKLAWGMADNMLCTTVLATRKPVVIAPAMNVGMWENSVTQENVDRLKKRGFIFVGPGKGWLAEGKVGFGRMSEPVEIIDCIKQVLGRGGDLAGRRIVVTAGGTQEPIDPVRHVSNKSSGKMGYAIAEAARDRGAEVTLIAAPTGLPDPGCIGVQHVCTAEEMYEATRKAVSGCDVLIMAAAVADYRPAIEQPQKIKKSEPAMTLDLVRTRDILGSLEGGFVKVGFAAESNGLIANARKKLTGKRLDLIVANDITRKDAGFGSDMNKITILARTGKADDLPLMPKREAADRILDKVAALLARKSD